jgi:hypothetical protein
MVKITNGVQTAEVPKGAFISVFKPQGWRLASDIPEEVKAPKKDDSPAPPKAPEHEDGQSKEGHGDNAGDGIDDGDENGITDEELLLIPVDEMSKEQLVRAAQIKGADISECKKKSEVREVVRKAIEG